MSTQAVTHKNANTDGTGRLLTSAQRQRVGALKIASHYAHLHKMAHLAASGQIVHSQPALNVQTGPDGRIYTVASTVQTTTLPPAPLSTQGHRSAHVKSAELMAAYSASTRTTGESVDSFA